MPIYEYRCTLCGKGFETLVRIGSGGGAPRCPACGSRTVKRLFSLFGFSSGGRAVSSVAGAGCSTCAPAPGQCPTCGEG